MSHYDWVGDGDGGTITSVNKDLPAFLNAVS